MIYLQDFVKYEWMATLERQATELKNILNLSRYNYRMGILHMFATDIWLMYIIVKAFLRGQYGVYYTGVWLVCVRAWEWSLVGMYYLIVAV